MGDCNADLLSNRLVGMGFDTEYLCGGVISFANYSDTILATVSSFLLIFILVYQT